MFDHFLIEIYGLHSFDHTSLPLYPGSSQNGLLATYALETLVLCIFNIFRTQLTTPITVLAKFLGEMLVITFDYPAIRYYLGNGLFSLWIHDLAFPFNLQNILPNSTGLPVA